VQEGGEAAAEEEGETTLGKRVRCLFETGAAALGVLTDPSIQNLEQFSSNVENCSAEGAETQCCFAAAVNVVLHDRKAKLQLSGRQPILPTGEMLKENRGPMEISFPGWDGK
jgi:hypothetical protein